MLDQYRSTLVEMHTCRVEYGGSSQPWNRLVNQLQRLHLALRQSAQGRAGISALITDDVLTVRQWAAMHALSWDETAARAELERQAASGPSLPEFEAKITIREHDAGRLNTTWLPK
jgi:hypothetical protein